MKTAVLLTGHMRTFARTLPTQHWHLYRHLPNPDFYVSTLRDDDSPSAELLRDRYPESKVEIDTIDQQPDLPIPVPPTDPQWRLGQPYTHEPYALSVPPLAVLRQLWQLNYAWEHFEATRAGSYDLIVRIRPDSWFHTCTLPRLSTILKTECFTPWWGRFGGINDRLALLGPTAAAVYHTTYQRHGQLLAAGCPLHPESLLKTSLELWRGLQLHDTLQAEFSTCKHDGTRPPEITASDIAHLKN
jgi:hypothetical protein